MLCKWNLIKQKSTKNWTTTRNHRWRLFTTHFLWFYFTSSLSFHCYIYRYVISLMSIIIEYKRTCISLITARTCTSNTWDWSFRKILLVSYVYFILSHSFRFDLRYFHWCIKCIKFKERILWMNCVVKVKERNKIKYWVNERIVSEHMRLVRLVASPRYEFMS